MSDILNSQSLSIRDVIEAIVSNKFIVDYGYINKVYPDKTVDVTHSAKPVLLDGTELPETVTHNVEVLVPCGAGLSVRFDWRAGDKVLLLGLKDFVPEADKVTEAKAPKSTVHYSRATLKAIPLCVFDADADTTVDVENGKVTIETDKIVCDTNKIELNGNSKQFVTWSELNSALSSFVTNLSTALLAATYVNAAGTPTVLAWTGGTPPTTIDISSAKTTSVVTGG